jgi:fluoride exporter
MTNSLPTWFLVAMAGAAGTLLRYVVGGWLARATGGVFPWETFAINALGCLAVGVVAGIVDKGALLPPPLRMALMVGFIGGFTTFSTFALDAFRLAAASQLGAAVGYVFLSNLVGFAAVFAGYKAALVA